MHNNRTHVSSEEIINVVCEKFGVERKQLNTQKGKRGIMPLPVIRQICFYMLDRFTNMSLAKIGAEFDKDHATVLHSKKCVRDMKDTKDKDYYQKIISIELELNDKYRVYEHNRN